MTPDVTILKQRDDGTLLGADSDGSLYDGVRKRVPHSEFVIENMVTTTPEGDDEVLTRTETAFGMRVANSTLTRSAFVENQKKHLLATVVTTDGKPISDAIAQSMAEQAWAEEKALTKHKPAYETITTVDAAGNEEQKSREVGKVIIAWTKKEA